jgi:hypothetical protein
MLIPDHALKCVGFVVEHVGETLADIQYDHYATGFFVAVPSNTAPVGNYHLFVTAKHVAEHLKNSTIGILANQRGGGVMMLPIAVGKWFNHPTDASVDIAVLPFNWSSKLDIVSIPVERFLTPEKLKESRIGVGDEVYLPGLFSFAPGAKRNTPIVRFGNIAMLPDEQVQVDSGFVDAYLIEARSIGGISGSPVFVRKTVEIVLDGHQTNC